MLSRQIRRVRSSRFLREQPLVAALAIWLGAEGAGVALGLWLGLGLASYPLGLCAGLVTALMVVRIAHLEPRSGGQCGFCGVEGKAADRLFEGRHADICDRCVVRLHDELSAPQSPRPTHEPRISRDNVWDPGAADGLSEE